MHQISWLAQVLLGIEQARATYREIMDVAQCGKALSFQMYIAEGNDQICQSQFQFLYSGLQWSDVPFLFTGIDHTLLLTLITVVFGTLLGVLIGWARENSRFAKALFWPLLDVVRSRPLIIQFILVNSFFAMAGYPCRRRQSVRWH